MNTLLVVLGVLGVLLLGVALHSEWDNGRTHEEILSTLHRLEEKIDNHRASLGGEATGVGSGDIGQH